MTEQYKAIEVIRDNPDEEKIYVYQCECGKIYEWADSACMCCILPHDMEYVDMCPIPEGSWLLEEMTEEEFHKKMGIKINKIGEK